LLRAVESRYAARDVPAAGVGDEQDDDQHDAADHADRPGVLGRLLDGLLRVGRARQPDGCARRGRQSREQDGRPGGGEPPEEGRADLDAAVLLLLPRHDGVAVTGEGLVGPTTIRAAGVRDARVGASRVPTARVAARTVVRGRGRPVAGAHDGRPSRKLVPCDDGPPTPSPGASGGGGTSSPGTVSATYSVTT